jgi:hypothetical protein
MASRVMKMDCELIGGCYVHKSLPLEMSGSITFRVYIPTNKTYFQVVRILWLSWLKELIRNSEIFSSTLVVWSSR